LSEITGRRTRVHPIPDALDLGIGQSVFIGITAIRGVCFPGRQDPVCSGFLDLITVAEGICIPDEREVAQPTVAVALCAVFIENGCDVCSPVDTLCLEAGAGSEEQDEKRVS